MAEIITVLMSTYNGEKYLREQIESILNQKNVRVQILVRDDGSTDHTHIILDEYQKNGKLNWYTGMNLKSSKSFMNLVTKAPETEYYAFCDQDDVWNNDKLYRAVNKLKSMGNMNIPRLYCSDYQLVDEKLNNLPENDHATTTTFSAALVSSCCTGCTVVFNNALKKKLCKQIPDLMVMHDDWVHKVCLAIGGTVYYDKNKTLKYRQHGNNVDGGVHKLSSRIKNIYYRIKKADCTRSRQIQEIIDIFGNEMSDSNLKFAKYVAGYRDRHLIGRICLAFDKNIKTPYKRLNRGYRLAIILKYF